MATHYVIACWSGLRRVNPPKYLQDRSGFLRRHIDSLRMLKHSIDRISIVVNHNPEDPPSFRHYISSIPKRLGSARVKIIERPNVGYSYGAYSQAYDIDRGASSLDNHILMEDDYVFTRDGFDTDLTEALEQSPKAGFISFVIEGGSREWIMSRARKEAPGGEAVAQRLAAMCPERFHYARISVGMARGRALGDVWRKFGRLPHSEGTNHTECKFEGQFGLTMALESAGWEIADMLPRCRAQAFSPRGEILSYGPADKSLFVVPVQTLLQEEGAN
jgi:hypothetical protein